MLETAQTAASVPQFSAPVAPMPQTAPSGEPLTADAVRARYDKFISGQDDIVSVVLKAHLLLEEASEALCRAHMRTPEAIDWRNLGARRKIDLLEGLGPDGLSQDFFAAMRAFNELRNAFAHSLDHPRLQDKYDAALSRHYALEPGAESEDASQTPHDKLRAMTWDLLRLMIDSAHGDQDPVFDTPFNAAWLDNALLLSATADQEAQTQ